VNYTDRQKLQAIAFRANLKVIDLVSLSDPSQVAVPVRARQSRTKCCHLAKVRRVSFMAAVLRAN
jgi:hypothetical protein